MALRLVQAGEGNPQPLVVLYLVGPPMDPELREALGKTPAIVAYDDAMGDRLSATISYVSGKTGADISDVILVGYSAGCKAVRRELVAGQDVSGVLAIDGTHANLPPDAWQIDVWRHYAEEARIGRRLFVATCTQNTYVETNLPVGQRYSATVTVLRSATNFALIPSDDPAGEHDGALHAYSYSSLPVDKAAHGRQQTEVLPKMLARHARPWLEKEREYAPDVHTFTSALTPEERAMAENAVELSLQKWREGQMDGADEVAISLG